MTKFLLTANLIVSFIIIFFFKSYVLFILKSEQRKEMRPIAIEMNKNSEFLGIDKLNEDDVTYQKAMFEFFRRSNAFMEKFNGENK